MLHVPLRKPFCFDHLFRQHAAFFIRIRRTGILLLHVYWHVLHQCTVYPCLLRGQHNILTLCSTRPSLTGDPNFLSLLFCSQLGLVHIHVARLLVVVKKTQHSPQATASLSICNRCTRHVKHGYFSDPYIHSWVAVTIICRFS